MRNTTTQTISIQADYEKAFDYISNPLTQMEWATNFISKVEKGENGFLATTPSGEVPLEFKSDKSTGTIDIILGGGEPIPTRLVKNETGCEYLFTLFQPQQMPTEVWEKEGIPGLQMELKQLKAILESK